MTAVTDNQNMYSWHIVTIYEYGEFTRFFTLRVFMRRRCIIYIILHSQMGIKKKKARDKSPPLSKGWEVWLSEAKGEKLIYTSKSPRWLCFEPGEKYQQRFWLRQEFFTPPTLCLFTHNNHSGSLFYSIQVKATHATQHNSCNLTQPDATQCNSMQLNATQCNSM